MTRHPNWTAPGHPSTPESEASRATLPRDGYPDPAEALRLGKAMRSRLHTAVTAAVTEARKAGATDAAALGLVVLMAKTSAQDGRARIWASELGRWLGVSQSTVAHDVLPALRTSGLLATRPLTDAAARTRGLECVVMPMWRARRDGHITHPLALTRPELATLLRFLEALIGPGWQPADPQKTATPAGLLAERTGRGAATDRLALLLMALNTTDRGRLRLCPGTVDARRGRPATTVARLLAVTPAAGAKVLGRLSALGVVAITQAATATGMDGKSRVVLPALAEALRRRASTCPSASSSRPEAAPRRARTESAARSAAAGLVSAPECEPSSRSHDDSTDVPQSPLPVAEARSGELEDACTALGDLALRDDPSAQRPQGIRSSHENVPGAIRGHDAAAHLHTHHSPPPGHPAQVPDSGWISGEAVGGATTVAGSARARAKKNTPPMHTTSPASPAESAPGANTSNRRSAARRDRAEAGAPTRTFRHGVREVLAAVSPIRDVLNHGQLVTAAAAINAVLCTTSPVALGAQLQARLAPMTVGTPGDAADDRGVIVSPLGWLLSQLPQVTRCPDCGYTFHGRRTGAHPCAPCQARRDGRTTAPCRDCGQDRELTAGRICGPCSNEHARLTVCGPCGTRRHVHPITGMCPPCESEARSRSAEELAPLSEEGRKAYLRLTRGSTPAATGQAPRPRHSGAWTTRLSTLANRPLPEDESSGWLDQQAVLHAS
ncbi:hypothetical protein [Streptomyces sp. bgisy060]|uniref:hypothetical protein n=1 Tax=Streptomyces sp. bgisy060 TaxID=3413775 RepID=UPI003EB72220